MYDSKFITIEGKLEPYYMKSGQKVSLQLLKPNGILVILVPNIDSLAARIMHEKCVTFSGDTHINFFNNETLTKIQEMNGFKVLDCETVFSEINTIKNYLNYSDAYFGEGKNDFEFLNPKYIHDNLMGYAIITVAKIL